MSSEQQRRTVTVEAADGEATEISDGQRMAWRGIGDVSMTLRVGPDAIWFEKETCPAGIRLPSWHDGSGRPSWSIGGGGMRTSAESKLSGLLRSGWELVDDDVGLRR
jgi:hypothetical protein